MLRILTLDIETSPITAYVWGTFKQNVGLNQIIKDWRLLSVAFKWYDEPHVKYWEAREAKDEMLLLDRLRDLLDRADIVVGHNIEAFDLRKINARLLEAGFPPPTPYRTIDTLLKARDVAKFTSAKLEWLSEALVPDEQKDKHKEFPGFSLWDECLKGNPKAWDAMREYNKQDVLATEKLYEKLRPWMTNHPNVNTDSTTHTCPRCGSKSLERRGYYRTNAGLYTRYRCKSCNGWSATRYTENTIQQRRNILRSI